MSLDEVIKVIATARAAYPGMSMVEGMAQVWHGALGDLRLQECQQAIVVHTRHSTAIVTPADIRKLVQSARADAVMRMPIEGVGDRASKPEWFQTVVDQHKAANAEKWAAVRERNKAAGAAWAAKKDKR